MEKKVRKTIKGIKSLKLNIRFLKCLYLVLILVTLLPRRCESSLTLIETNCLPALKRSALRQRAEASKENYLRVSKG